MRAFTAISVAKSFLSLAQKDPQAAQDLTNMKLQVNENWDAGRHGPVLKKLIAKKARQMGRLSQDEAELLSTLQSMRRASLPPSMSYEEFIRERKRVEDLAKVMDAMAEYKRKYCAASHGAEERS